MTRKHVVTAAFSLFSLGLLVRCVDLFHDTDGFADKAIVTDTCKMNAVDIRSLAFSTCAKIASCLGPIGKNAVGECIVEANRALDCNGSNGFQGYPVVGARKKYWDCVTTALDCASMGKCATVENVATCDSDQRSCFSGDPPQFPFNVRADCVGARKYSSFEYGGKPVAWAESCAAHGQVCLPTGECGGDGNPCTAACSEDRKSVRGCAATGARDVGESCVDIGGGECKTVRGIPGCIPADAGPGACTKSANVECDATEKKAMGCLFGQPEVVACDAFGPGFSCSAHPDAGAPATAGCVNEGAEACDVDRCAADGKTLKACVLGSVVTIDCSEHGFVNRKFKSCVEVNPDDPVVVEPSDGGSDADTGVSSAFPADRGTTGKVYSAICSER